MKKVISKPHLFFWGLIPVFFVIYLINGKSTIDVNIGFTYYEIEIKILCVISSLFFGLIGFNYFAIYWADKKLRNWLTIIHLILQILALVPFIYLLLSVTGENNLKSVDNMELLVFLNFIGLLLFLLASLIHLINFFVSLFLKKE